MQRFSLIALCTIGLAAASIGSGQDATPKASSFTVKCVLLPHGTESIAKEVSTVKEDVETESLVQNTFKGDDGSITTYSDNRDFVPTPSLMKKEKPGANAEYIPVGPRLHYRVRKAPNDLLLLDATLSETVTEKHKPYDGFLTALKTEVRHVQPVRLDESVTLEWPQPKDGSEARRVMITISAAK